jgi:hypothetical protein
MIRISFICLATVAVSGALLLANKGTTLHPAIWALLPMHFELAIWGWLVQFVMGTAYWMFPRHLTGKPRGPETLAWIVAAFLNTGILFIILGSYISGGQLFSAAGRILTAISILIFIGLMAGRAVSYRNVHNHETGEV